MTLILKGYTFSDIAIGGSILKFRKTKNGGEIKVAREYLKKCAPLEYPAYSAPNRA